VAVAGARPSYVPPSRLLLAAELPRAALEAATLATVWPFLRLAPKGDGHPVLVLPGFGASDMSTRALRIFLRDRGYHVHAWRLGRNLGPRPDIVVGLRKRIAELARRHGRTMSLVGWSLGGIYAREIARAAPAVVRQVITLGSPMHLRDRRASNATRVFETVTRSARQPVFVDLPPPEEERGPLPVPSTAIYSRTDGIVPWRSCVEVGTERCESVEVPGSHTGLGHNAAALWVVADRMAQPEGSWRPFTPPRGPARVLFQMWRPAEA
jgi:pimeloyl-ACP methyl ester carboxylesterase